MADAKGRSSDHRHKQSRLQRRAPASIQINRSTDWNEAIPLLSPLITSPSSPESRDLTAEIIQSCNKEQSRNAKAEKPVVFEKWQHPAAPFCYEPAPLVPFVGLSSS